MNTKDEITKRQEVYQMRRGELALERLALTRRIEEIDRDLATYEAAVQANAQALKDLGTEAVIAAAKAAAQPTQTPGAEPEA